MHFQFTASLAGALTAFVLAVANVSPALSDPAAHPGHAIADRFAADSDRARAAETARKEAARQEVQRLRKEQAEKVAKEKVQRAWESELLARTKAEAEERRELEAAAARLDAARIARETKEAEVERQRTQKALEIEVARQAEEARVAEETRKAEQIKRDAEALRLAAERTAAEEARKAEEARRIETARIAGEAKRTEQQRIETARKAEDAARFAAETRRAEQTARAAEEAKRAEGIRKANESLRLSAERAAAEAAKSAEEAQRTVTRATDEETRRVGALETDAEIERVAERLRRIRAEHLARHSGSSDRALETSSTTVAANKLGGPTMAEAAKVAGPDLPATPVADIGPARAYPHERSDGRVTVMLQMEPRFRRGRGHESMDPVLCVSDGCYVSNGPESPATFLPGRNAMRFGNVVGRRAGACNHAYTCVFRDIELGSLPAELQPVDIRVLRHDRRQPESVEALSTCRASPGRLACKDPIRGDGYTMWVIPESVATRLPVDLFGAAAAEGPVNEPHAALAPRRGRW